MRMRIDIMTGEGFRAVTEFLHPSCSKTSDKSIVVHNMKLKHVRRCKIINGELEKTVMKGSLLAYIFKLMSNSENIVAVTRHTTNERQTTTLFLGGRCYTDDRHTTDIIIIIIAMHYSL